jgi:hypothetical protein
LKDKDFIEIIFELAYGDEAINKGFTKAEVVAKIQEYSNHALAWEEINEAWEEIQP